MKLSDWHHQRPPSIAFGLRGSGASSATAPAAPQTVFTSLNQLAGSAIPSVGVDSVRTEGFAAAGDGGGALYRRSPTEPPHAGKIRSADGAWWEYIPDKIGWNIRTFGALGDGVTDDNPSISAALSTAAFFAGSHCQQTVYVPQSDSAYIFTTISVGSYVELLGLGGVLRLRDNVCVDEDTFYYPINNLGQSNTTFRNLRIDGNGGANTLFRVADAITCVGRNSSVLDCVIDDAPDSGITFSQTPGGICRGNIIDGASDAGIYVNDSNESDPSTDGTIISECTVRNAAVAGYSIKRSSAAMTLTNCTAARCGNGVTVEDFGVGNGGAPAELVIANIVLRDIGYTHRATNIAERGLSLTFCDHVTVTGVTAVNVSGIGLYLSGAKNCAVSGCSLAGYKTDPYTIGDGNVGLLMDERNAVPCTNVSVTGCQFEGFNDEGAYLQDARHSAIIANGFPDSGGSVGMLLGANIADCTITQNNVAGLVQDLAVTAGAFNNIIKDNIERNGTLLQRNGIRINQAITSPVGIITPLFAGEIFFITAGSKLFLAIGTGVNDWVQMN